MKIYEGQGLKFNQLDTQNKKNAVEKNDFQSILDKINSTTSNKVAAVSSNAQTPVINSIGMLINTTPAYSSSAAGAKEQVLTGLKDTLNLVDQYAQKLADTTLPSKNLSPLVEQLEQNMDALKDMSTAAGVDDKLKSIITDVTGTISVEIAKFKRGDYL
jgi:hypothetical protein